jgi:hypothetical protein
MSGIDGSGARAAWVLFDDGFHGLALCSVLVSDTAGVLDAAGGEITKKRLEAELAKLRASQKLPWVELPPEYVITRIADADALHARLGTKPPSGFSRWEKLLTSTGAGTRASATPLPAATGALGESFGAPTDARSTQPDPSLVEQSARLFELPELRGWFLEPERVQADAVQLLEARSSRLVVSEHVKAERERAIVNGALDREMTPEARARWSLRLVEMALIFDLTGRPDDAALVRATARALVDPGQQPARIAFARGLAERALEIAAEVASGRLRAEDWSRTGREPQR